MIRRQCRSLKGLRVRHRQTRACHHSLRPQVPCQHGHWLAAPDRYQVVSERKKSASMPGGSPGLTRKVVTSSKRSRSHTSITSHPANASRFPSAERGNRLQRRDEPRLSGASEVAEVPPAGWREGASRVARTAIVRRSHIVALLLACTEITRPPSGVTAQSRTSASPVWPRRSACPIPCPTPRRRRLAMLTPCVCRLARPRSPRCRRCGRPMRSRGDRATAGGANRATTAVRTQCSRPRTRCASLAGTPARATGHMNGPSVDHQDRCSSSRWPRHAPVDAGHLPSRQNATADLPPSEDASVLPLSRSQTRRTPPRRS